MSCQSCEALMINGVYCHEIGCPDAWRDYDRDCAWCGENFVPERELETCCGDSCARAYYG